MSLFGPAIAPQAFEKLNVSLAQVLGSSCGRSVTACSRGNWQVTIHRAKALVGHQFKFARDYPPAANVARSSNFPVAQPFFGMSLGSLERPIKVAASVPRSVQSDSIQHPVFMFQGSQRAPTKACFVVALFFMWALNHIPALAIQGAIATIAHLIPTIVVINFFLRCSSVALAVLSLIPMVNAMNSSGSDDTGNSAFKFVLAAGVAVATISTIRSDCKDKHAPANAPAASKAPSARLATDVAVLLPMPAVSAVFASHAEASYTPLGGRPLMTQASTHPRSISQCIPRTDRMPCDNPHVNSFPSGANPYTNTTYCLPSSSFASAAAAPLPLPAVSAVFPPRVGTPIMAPVDPGKLPSKPQTTVACALPTKRGQAPIASTAYGDGKTVGLSHSERAREEERESVVSLSWLTSFPHCCSECASICPGFSRRYSGIDFF
jgi:hypothetical protein